MTSYIQACRRKDIVLTAVKMSLLVGSLLALINHGPALITGEAQMKNYAQILLTYLVPYAVSTYSSVKMLRNQQG